MGEGADDEANSADRGRFRGRRCDRSALRGDVDGQYGGHGLAWFGNKDDGKCLSYSNGQPVYAGTPSFNGGNGPDAGWSTGPLLPGTTINQGIG